MKPTVDADNSELVRILDALLANDIDITARAVSRHHPTLHNASAFTRSNARMRLITQAQERQRALRKDLNPHFNQSISLGDQLKESNELVKQLTCQVRALAASHVACIQAVKSAGGLAGLERFWKDYKKIGESLRAFSVNPDLAEVHQLTAIQRKLPKSQK